MLSYIGLFGAAIIAHFGQVVYSSSSSYTYCYNYTQCQNATIDTKYAACYGFYGCESADIDSQYTLAYGELGCYDADVESKYTYAYGHYGAYAASLGSYHVYAYGYEAARISDIEPYIDSLSVYLYGYYAGYGADISCYSGDTCYIYCGSSKGCYKVDFYCYSGATCYYDCSGDDVCPTTYSGVDSDLTYVTSAGTSSTSSSASLTKKQKTSNSNGDDDEQAKRAQNIADNAPSMLHKNIEIDSNSKITSNLAVIYTGLTDEQITEYYYGNQMTKDKSKIKLQQDTLDDTNLQLRMTFEQEYWLTGQLAQQAEEEREEQNEKEEEQNEQGNDENDNENEEENQSLRVNEQQYANIKSFTNYKRNGGGNDSFFGLSLEDHGMGLIIDFIVVAIGMQTYNYYMKSKAYQSL